MKKIKDWLIKILGGRTAIIYVVDKETMSVTKHWINSQLTDTTYRIRLDKHYAIDFTTNTHKVTWIQ